jgi:ABC-type antimicrobial peptide transport system permease subunit
MNERLDFLLRKNKGKDRLEDYKNVLLRSGLNILELKYLNLEESDKVIKVLKNSFNNVDRETELLDDKSFFIDSDLMRKIFLGLSNNDISYIFTDDFEYCGMFVVDAKRGLETALNIAKEDIQNTCFILDSNYRYYFAINYNDENNNNPNTYDIQLKNLQTSQDFRK